MSKRRRSTAVSFTALTFAAGTTLAACGQPQQRAVPNAQAQERAAAASAAATGEAAAETGFASLQDCKDAAPVGVDCDAAWAEAQAAHAATAPAFQTQAECEAQWGDGQCQTTQRNGSSMFMPLLAGMLLGRALGGGFGGSRPMYRDRAGGYYGGGAGGRTYYGNGGFGGGRFQPGPNASRSAGISPSRTTTARGGFGSSASGRSVGG